MTEIIEVVTLAVQRMSSTALLFTIVFGLITGFIVVGQFKLSLKQLIVDSILVIILFSVLVVDAALNSTTVSGGGNGTIRSTNGVAALLLYLLFLGCASIGAKTQKEVDHEDTIIRKKELDDREMIRREVAAENVKERQIIRGENALETNDERQTVNVDIKK